MMDGKIVSGNHGFAKCMGFRRMLPGTNPMATVVITPNMNMNEHVETLIFHAYDAAWLFVMIYNSS